LDINPDDKLFIGGGMWFSLIKPDYIVSFSLARSEDEFAFYTTLGFMF
jgi:hypothetical protein